MAVASFVLDAIGPAVDAGWMTAVSPCSWYLDNEPLANGFDLPGPLLLAIIPVVAVAAGLVRFVRRDLMVSPRVPNPAGRRSWRGDPTRQPLESGRP